jgi:phosphorylcholine metabolism protein LicD
VLYFLEGGSTIGALRHGGIIPWDDDLDIIIRAEDEVMFLGKVREELLEKKKIKIVKNTKDGPWDYKLFSTSQESKNHVFCDVFVIELDKTRNTYIFKNPSAQKVLRYKFKESLIHPILTKFGSFQMRVLPSYFNDKYFSHVYGKHWKTVAKTHTEDHYTHQWLISMSFEIPESIKTRNF